MGTIRNNFAAVFLPLVLMSSTSQSSWVHGSNEDSLKRNSLLDAITDSHYPSTASSNYECLYVDPNLPPCDFTLMFNLEDSTSSRNILKRDIKGNIDFSNVDVTVYTIEGCLPSRLPFRMPSCHGISLDRIVDIRRLRPFTVNGVTKPPFVFPKFNYARWLRMIKQLQNRAPTKASHQAGSSDGSSSSQSVQGLTEELMNAATTKDTMPNAIAASMKTSNGSSNKLIPGSESPDQLTKSRVDDGNSATPSSNTEIPLILQNHNEFNSESNKDDLKSSNDGSKINESSDRVDPDITEILAIRKSRFMREQSVMKEPSNVLSNYANSQKSLQSPTSVQVDETDNGDVDDLPLTEIAPAALRSRREISFPVSTHEIGGRSKVREPISSRWWQRNRKNSNLNQLTDSSRYTKRFNVRSKGRKLINKNKVRTPFYKSKSDYKSRNKVKYDRWSSMKPTWQKTKKYRR